MTIHKLLLWRIEEEARANDPKAVITQEEDPSLVMERITSYATIARSLAILKSIAFVGKENMGRRMIFRKKAMIKMLQQ